MSKETEVRQALGITAMLAEGTDVAFIEQRVAVRYGVLVSLYKASQGAANRYCLWSNFVAIAEMSEEEAEDVLNYWLDLGMIAEAGVWTGKEIVEDEDGVEGEGVFRLTGQGIDTCEYILVNLEVKDPINMGLDGRGEEEEEEREWQMKKLPLA